MITIDLHDYLSAADIKAMQDVLPSFDMHSVSVCLSDDKLVPDAKYDSGLDELESRLYDAEVDAVQESPNGDGSPRATAIARLADKIFNLSEGFYDGEAQPIKV